MNPSAWRCLLLVAAMTLASVQSFAAGASEAPAKAKPATAVSDARIRSQLPGLWNADQVLGDIKVTATSNYRRDGKVVYDGHIQGPGVDLTYHVTSSWKVEGGVLVTTILQSDQPQMLAPGSVERDTVLEIGPERFVYRDSEGDTYTERRIQR